MNGKTIANLLVGLGLDSSKFKQGMGEAEQQTTGFAQKMQGVGKGMMKAGGIATAGLTTPIVAGLGKAVMSASDLGESISAVETVFGDSKNVIYEYGQTSAEAVGLSEERFNALGIVTGSFLQNLGYDSQTAAQETINLTERASDMAAVFNTDVDQALQAIQSGLKGEFNPLEQFGVKMNQAAIDAKALEMGLVDTEVSMLDVEKSLGSLGTAQDSWNAIVQQSVKEGDLTKAQHEELAQALYGLDDAYETAGTNSTEFNSAVESARQTWAKYSDVLGEDGRTALLDYADGLVGMEKAMAGSKTEITDNAKAQAALAIVMEQTERIQGTFQEESESLGGTLRIVKAQLGDAAAALGQQLLPYVTQAANFVSDLVTKFNNLSPAAQKIIVIVLLVVAAIGPLLLVFGALITSIGTVAGFLTGTLIPALAPVIVPILAIIAVVALLVAAWKTNFLGIRDFTATAWERLKVIFTAVKTWLSVNIPAAIAVVKNWWDTKFMPAIQAVWNFIKTKIIPLFQAVADFMNAAFSLAITALAGLWQNVLQPALQTIWDWIKAKLQPVFDKLAEFFNSTLQPAIQKIADWFDVHMMPAIRKVSNFIKGTFQGVVDKLKGAFDNIGGAIEKVIGFIQGLTEKLKNVKLPDWLTPGSPTPFETGLWGINSALKAVSRTSLPTLRSQLEMTEIPNDVRANTLSQPQTVTNYNLTVNSREDQDNLYYLFDMMQAYGD